PRLTRYRTGQAKESAHEHLRPVRRLLRRDRTSRIGRLADADASPIGFGEASRPVGLATRSLRQVATRRANTSGASPPLRETTSSVRHRQAYLLDSSLVRRAAVIASFRYRF